MSIARDHNDVVTTEHAELTSAQSRRVRRQVKAHRRASVARTWPLYFGGLLVLALAAFGLLWSRGWLPGIFAPCRLVVRGCELTAPADIVALMECDGRQAVPALWARARNVKQPDERWLRSVGVRSDWGRSAVIEVSERRPLMQLIGAGFPYWLCDDGELVILQQNDRGTPFNAIARLPRVNLAEDPGAGQLTNADEYLDLVATCDQYLPGNIERIEINREGDVSLYQRSGFEIKLGREDHTQRIAALPQVLRVSEGHKDRLRYIYATEVNGTLVFYEKWKGPAKPLTDS